MIRIHMQDFPIIDAAISGCDLALDYPHSNSIINTFYAYVEYRVNPGYIFSDYSHLKRIYCPCNGIWPSIAADILQGKSLVMVQIYTCISQKILSIYTVAYIYY